MDKNKQIGKLIHISKDADKTIKVKAANDGTNAKNYIEDLIEKHAQHLTKSKKK